MVFRLDNIIMSVSFVDFDKKYCEFIREYHVSCEIDIDVF